MADYFYYFPVEFKPNRILSFLKGIHSTDQSDEELVALYQKEGDIRVLGELYGRHMDLLYGVCLKYLKGPDAAKDAVMAVFEELIHKLKNHDVKAFKGWVYVVAKNHCLMQLRSEKRLPKAEDADIMQIPQNQHLPFVLEKEGNLISMENCLEQLSPDQRESIKMFYLQEKSYKEIAGLTQTDWGKVRSLIQNARRNLKICMEKSTTDKEM